VVSKRRLRRKRAASASLLLISGSRWRLSGSSFGEGQDPVESNTAQQGAAEDAAPVLVGAVRDSFGATPLRRGLSSAAGAAQLSADPLGGENRDKSTTSR
jgi:hypothetical protein